MRRPVYPGRRARSMALLRRDAILRCHATPSVNIHLHPHTRDGNNALACPRSAVSRTCTTAASPSSTAVRTR